ncbi:hypothetical protein GJ496_001367 [Pomphorhynchus laevis]|nr:hypothetical protein GJ496_001367 [Pomphorhynchus laevis]
MLSELSKNSKKSFFFPLNGSNQINIFNNRIAANAFCLNKESNMLVAAGRSAFKLFAIDIKDEDDQCFYELREVTDMISRKNRPFGHAVTDVAWSRAADTRVAISFALPKILLFDIEVSNDLCIIKQRSTVDNIHIRTVNRIHFHPIDANVLLTGSQDGACAILDVRQPNRAQTFQAYTDSGVRDVEFHPFNSFVFASGSDNGLLSIWDIRRNDKPENLLTAHTDPILSIDWHLEHKELIATASRDKQVKVFDLSRECDPCVHTVFAPYGLARVKWRPSYNNQFASCSFLLDFSISMWDITSPFMPFASFHHHSHPVAEMYWCDKNAIISCGKDNNICIASIDQAFKIKDVAPAACLDLNVRSHILCYSKESYSNNISHHNSCVTTPPQNQDTLLSKHSVPFHVYFSKEMHADQMLFRCYSVYSTEDVTSIAIKNALISENVCKDVSLVWRILTNIVDLVRISNKHQKQSRVSRDRNTDDDNNRFKNKTIRGKSAVADTKQQSTSDFIWETSLNDCKSESKVNDDEWNPRRFFAHPRAFDLLQEDCEIKWQFDNGIVRPVGAYPGRAHYPQEILTDHYDDSSVTIPWDSYVPIRRKTVFDEFVSSKDFIDDFTTDNIPEFSNFWNKKDSTVHSSRSASSALLNLLSAGKNKKTIEAYNAPVPSYVYIHYFENKLNSLVDIGQLPSVACILLTLAHNTPDILDAFQERFNLKKIFQCFIQLLMRCNMICYAREILKYENNLQYIIDSSLNSNIYQDHIPNPKYEGSSGDLRFSEEDNQGSLRHMNTDELDYYNEIEDNFTLQDCEQALLRLQCMKCGRSFSNGKHNSSSSSYACHNCRTSVKCILCRQPVKGIYISCIVCSHGGHMDHVKLWFAKKRRCPSGCSHPCVFNKYVV